MNEYVPVVLGYGFILVVLTACVLFPRAWWAQELARRYGITPSGPFGVYTRRDHVLRALLSFLAAVGCTAGSLGAFAVMERLHDNTRPGQIAAVYFFGLFLMAGVAALAGLIAVFQAIFYRPRRPPRPLDPRAWHAVADLLDRLAVQPVPEPEWAAFASQPQVDPVLERVRVSLVRLCGGNPDRFRGPLRKPARSWAVALRAAAI